MARLRKGDEVMIIAGKDKGSTGKVLSVDAEKGRVIVEGLNQVKRHTKPTSADAQGGIVTKSAPLDSSNVMVLDPETKQPARVGWKFIGKDGERFANAKEAKASLGADGTGKPEKVRVYTPTKRGA